MKEFRARISAELDTTQLQKDLQNLDGKIKITADTSDSKQKIDAVEQSIGKADNSAKRFGSSAKKAFSFGGIATLASKTISAINSAVRDAVTDVKALDAAITDLRIATGESYEYVSKLVDKYNGMAKNLGATTTEITSAADTWIRQGYSMAETNNLIHDSMVLSKVGQLDSADAATYLTSALKGYKLSAQDALSVVDKLSAVDLVSATSVGGLAEAMSRVAGGANNAGVSMDRLLGYLATVGDITQKSMSSIGNSFQSLFVRMGNLKLSKLRFVDENGIEEDLSNVETVLGGLGIKLRENNNEFRNFGEVLDEVSRNWKNYSTVQQSAVAQAMAGAYHRENFVVLMENYERAAEYAGTAANSAGTANSKFSAYLDSIEAKTKSLQAAFEALAFNGISTEVIGGIIDASTAVVEFADATNVVKGTLVGIGFTAAVKGYTALRTSVLNAVFALNQFNDAIQLSRRGNLGADDIERLANMTEGLSQSQLRAVLSSKSLTTEQRIAILTTQGLSREEAEATLSTMGLSGATVTLSGALKGLWATIKANPLGVIATAIGIAASAFTTFQQNAEQARTELVQTTRDAADSAATLSTEITELTNKYIGLSNAVDKDDSAKETLIETQAELIKKLGIEGEKVDELIEKYGSLDAAIKAASLSELQNAERDLRARVNIEEDEVVSAAKPSKMTGMSMQSIDVVWTPAERDVNLTALDELKKAGMLSEDSYYDIHGADLHFADMDLSSVEGVVDAHTRLGQMLDIVADKVGSNNVLYNALYRQYNQVNSAIGEYTDSVTDLNTNLAQQEVLSATIGQELPKTKTEFDSFRQSIVDSVTSLGTYAGSAEDVKSAVDSVLSSQSAFVEFYNGTATAAETSTETIVSKTDEILTNFRKTITTLNAAVDEFNTDGFVSADKYNEVIALGEDYADLFTFTADGIQIETDALEELSDKLKTETSAQLAATNANEATICTIATATSALTGYSESTEDALDDISDLIDVQKELEEGVEYSNIQLIELLKKYPELASATIKTANGYKIEENAVQSLIAEKSKLLSVNESLLTQARRMALDAESNNNGLTSANAMAIITGYYAETGNVMTSWEDFLPAWQKHFDADEIPETFGETYRAFVESAIVDFASAVALEDLYDELASGDYSEGFVPEKTKKDDETAFEKAYKYHNHLLNMDKESVEDYLAWLRGAYQTAYAAGEMEIDDYYKYKEEVYSKEKELFADSISNTEHQIALLENATADNSDKIVSLYKEMQNRVHEQAEKYREMGLDDTHTEITELQNMWWAYADEIETVLGDIYNQKIDEANFAIETLKLNDADKSEVLSAYEDILQVINEEIVRYTDLGYSATHERVRVLTRELYDTKEDISEYLDEIVKEANNAVDGVQDVYTTLTDAAREYSATGALSVDSYQAILDLGVQYLTFLHDENGQLVINKQTIQQVIAAKTEELAVEQALVYAKQVVEAAELGNVERMIELTNVTREGTASTWEMVYSMLGLAKSIGAMNGIDGSYFDAAVANVDKLKSLSKTAVSTISTYYATLEDGYVSQEEGLNTILELTQDMIKWENEQLIDALEQEKEDYSDIIDQKKELIRLAKEQADRESSVAEKLEEAAKLQAQIAQLSLDDSREAQAQRRSLEEELTKLQKELSDEQADHSFEVQEEALDKELEAFEDTKDDEIEALEDMLSSTEKLYRESISRIENDWENLYSDLIDFNYNYGSMLESDLVAAWEAASAAVQKYGSYVEAVEGVKNNANLGEHTESSGGSKNESYVSGSSSADSIINRMRKNSLDWFTSDNRKAIEKDQQALADEWYNTFGEKLTLKNGSWYRPGESDPLYTLTDDEVGTAIVSKMEANAQAWHTASESEKARLAAENEELARLLENFLKKKIYKTESGVWKLGERDLFDVYHKGGVVGGHETLKDKEVLAKLKEDELVLTEDMRENLIKLFDAPIELESDRMFNRMGVNRDFVNQMVADNYSRYAVQFDDRMRRVIENAGNQANAKTEQKIEIGDIYAPMQVVQKLDEEEIKKHAKQIGEISAGHIREAFTKLGIKRTASLM